MRKMGLGGGVGGGGGGVPARGMAGEEGGGLAVYYCLKGSGCCVQINKREIIAEGLYIYFLS